MTQKQIISKQCVTAINRISAKHAKLASAQAAELISLSKRLCHYIDAGIDYRLVFTVCQKKIEYLLSAQSLSLLHQAARIGAAHYDGNKFVDTPYQLDEEELIQWLLTKNYAPLPEYLNQRGQYLLQKYLESQ